MAKHKVLVNEYFSRVVEIDAASADEAAEKVRMMWSTSEIVLTADDFYDVEFAYLNEMPEEMEG